MQTEPLLLLKRTRDKEGAASASLILYYNYPQCYFYRPSTGAYRSIYRKQLNRWLPFSRIEGEIVKEIQCKLLEIGQLTFSKNWYWVPLGIFESHILIYNHSPISLFALLGFSSKGFLSFALILSSVSIMFSLEVIIPCNSHGIIPSSNRINDAMQGRKKMWWSLM